MPKKQGGKKAAGGGGGKKNKKLDSTECISVREALLSYDLNKKKQQFESLNEEFAESKAIKSETESILELAKVEKCESFDKFMSEFQKYKNRYESEEQVGRENVLSTIHSNIQFSHDSKKFIEDLEQKCVDTVKEKERLYNEVLSGREFKNVLMGQNETRISKLTEQFSLMNQEYSQTKQELDRAFQVMQTSVFEETEMKISEQKHVVCDNVLETTVQANSRIVSETKECDWLKREIAWYKSEVASLQRDVDLLEVKNLDLIHRITSHPYSATKNNDLGNIEGRNHGRLTNESVPQLPSLHTPNTKSSTLENLITSHSKEWPVTFSMLQSIKTA